MNERLKAEMRQSLWSDWLVQEIRANQGKAQQFPISIAGFILFPLYGPTGGVHAASVCYIFQRGEGTQSPKILDGGDLGRANTASRIEIYELEKGWRYAAVEFTAAEEMSVMYESIFKARIMNACLELKEAPYEPKPKT